MVGILLGLTQMILEVKPRQLVGFKLFMFRFMLSIQNVVFVDFAIMILST